MMYYKFLAIFSLLFFSTTLHAQEDYLVAASIPNELTKNANIVVRQNDVTVNIKAIDDMEVVGKRIVTVLNENGMSDLGAYVFYDNHIKVKGVEAIIYDAYGKQLKKIRKKDFKDVSRVPDGTLYSDSRVKYLDYTPISYPFTVVFECETQTKNTANIPRFSPLRYYVTTENSTLTINYPDALTLHKKELHLEDFSISKNKEKGRVSYTIRNIAAIKPEKQSPSYYNLAPQVHFALNKFNYDGITAEINDWNEFGLWMYQNLIKGKATIDDATKTKILELTKNATTDKEKAKIVYEFMQNKTRYISVQVGIGGFQPIPANEVDKLGYGDCKGLTNYTMALLDAVGVTSYYTHVEAGSSKIDFYDDFASLAQGNHVILNIPNESEDIWLECTSQKVPFGHIGDFTDDRNVLVITPEGGKIKRTKKYETNENTQQTTGKYTLNAEGNISAEVSVVTKGIQYDNRYYLKDYSQKDLKKYYKNYWENINNITLTNIAHENNKDKIIFSENINFNASGYGIITGNRMLFAPNALNKHSFIPNRYRNRKFPLQISRGFYDTDDYSIILPDSYTIEAIPENVTHESKFGNYSVSIEKVSETTLRYKRSVKIKDGIYPKEDYKMYRKFLKQIAKFDNAKIVLIKK